MSALDDFNPNKPLGEWATYAPGRTPKWKVHARRGDARNAVSNHGLIALYHWVCDRWIEKARREGPQPERCEECGESTMHQSPYGLKMVHNRGYNMWDPRSEFKRIFVCPTCRHNL